MFPQKIIQNLPTQFQVLRRVPTLPRGGPVRSAGDAAQAAAVGREHRRLQAMGAQALVCRAADIAGSYRSTGESIVYIKEKYRVSGSLFYFFNRKR